MDAETCNQLAWQYLQAGETQLALEHALRAHELKRGDPDFLNTLGVAYGEAGRLDLAEATFRKLLRRKPGFVAALVNLAKSLEKQERNDEARAHYERALAIEPAFPKLAANLAKLYRDRGESARSRELLERRAAGVDPQDLALGLAQCEFDAGNEAAALTRLRDAAAVGPTARSALAHALLATGRWREGWREYARPGVEPLQGGKILLVGEQGIGDVLFFLRFARSLPAFALACEEKLRPILDVAAADADAPGYDRRIFLGDLPAALETDAAPPAWPLTVDPAAKREVEARLAALGPAPYLAVTWRAGTDTARGREFGAGRSSLTKAVPPKALGEALRGWRGTTLILQRGARSGDAAQFAAGFGAPFHDLSLLGDDLRALLAGLSLVDEYVGVSNTNMHLLAGLGRSARVLIPYPPEWRWLRREARSPWFPDFPVYRQPVSRDWAAPLAALRKDLGL